MGVFIPYCGEAPVPGSEAWNLDPVLLGGLALGAALYLAAAPRLLRVGPRDIAFFSLGWLVLTVAFVSPLCNLSVALFSARVGQHMVLALLAAPLMARGLVPIAAQPQAPSGLAWGSAVAFAAALWVWHSPGPYDATLQNNAVYWLMHATTILAALLLWVAIFCSNGLIAFLIIFATGLQMSFLGALLTLSGTPLFVVHEFTTAPWGLTWLQDQELGGLLMWVPAGLLLTAYSVVAFNATLRRMHAPDGLPVEEAI